MLDFFKKAIRAARNDSAPIQRPQAVAGLRRGGFVTVDPLPFRMQGQHLRFAPPAGSQKIEAYGVADLGASAELHRYYLSEDAWIQVSTTAGGIDEIKLWRFADTRHPPTRAAFDAWLQPGSELGRSSAEFAGESYRRVWGEDADWAPPVAFDEQVHTGSDTLPDYTTAHHAMLFEREVEAADRMEYLLISAELSGEDYSVVFSLGVDVTLADLNVT